MKLNMRKIHTVPADWPQKLHTEMCILYLYYMYVLSRYIPPRIIIERIAAQVELNVYCLVLRVKYVENSWGKMDGALKERNTPLRPPHPL